MEIRKSDFRLLPKAHQVKGVLKLIQNPYFGIFDEMGLGKTKQVIDAAQLLYSMNKIDRIIVVAPSSVRDVWFDDDLGELRKHLFLYSIIVRYHQNCIHWKFNPKERLTTFTPTRNGELQWIITNYEFIRRVNRLIPLLNVCNEKTLLVLDESSAIKSHKTKQTDACMSLRVRSGRVVLLNGTPVGNSPADLYSQSNIMDESILRCGSYHHFLARYAIFGGWKSKRVMEWRFLDDLRSRLKPYVIRRLKKDCLDLPPKLDPVIYTVTLTKETWEIYKRMRDDMVAWLENQTVSIAAQAVVKAMRLAQITTGFIGGVREDEWKEDQVTKEIGREKLDFFLKWLEEQLVNDPKMKLLVWCRFRRELQRLYSEVKKNFDIPIGAITGGQKSDERNYALRLLDPRTSPDTALMVVGNPKAGGKGLNLAAAHNVMYTSNGYSLMDRLQSEDRVHRPGQIFPVSYFDVLAVGPNGQKTIEHIILKAIRDKNDVANFTCKKWIDELKRIDDTETFHI
jgi:SNF2 family DNA or RNA helicase